MRSTWLVAIRSSRCLLGAWTKVTLVLPRLLGDVVGDVDVEAGVGAALLQAEAGLVELDADLDALVAGVVAAGRVAVAVAAARGEREGQGAAGEQGGDPSSVHVVLSFRWVPSVVVGVSG